MQMRTAYDQAEGPTDQMILDTFMYLWQHWYEWHKHPDEDKHWPMQYELPDQFRMRNIDDAMDKEVS